MLIGLGIIVLLGMFIFLAAPSWIFTKGEMPSEQEARDIKGEVLNFYTKQENESAIPSLLEKLNPLSIAMDKTGVLIIFRKDSYQKYGYYFSKDDIDPPENIKEHCVKKITDGLYYYHDAF